MRKLLPEITILFRPLAPPSLQQQLHELNRFTKALASWGPEFSTWYLGGASKDEALMYQVFDENGVTAAAYAVLKTQNDGREEADDIGMWNGEDGGRTAGIGYTLGTVDRPWVVNLRPRLNPGLTWLSISEVIKVAIEIWSPSMVMAIPKPYAGQEVFKDRPGVGWMLYLPRCLDIEKVPEARALVPVSEGKRQVGTIIVSQSDDVFDAGNPEHISAANAIEVRLVDQDLLPRFVDL